MTGDDFGRMAYLALLLVAVGGYMIADNRQSLGKMARTALAWGLIFVGVIAAYGLWNDIRSDVLPRQSVIAETGQVAADRRFDGHFYLDVEMNGQAIKFVVDTGASDVVLTLADARKVGIDPDTLAFTGIAMTANGEVRTATAMVEQVSLEGIEDRKLRVYVNEGEMDISLLGMAYLRRFSRIEIAGDQLILTR